MRITIKAKNLELTEELQNFIEEKIGSLKKFIKILKEEKGEGKTLAEAFVEVEKETMHHKKGQIFSVKASIYLPGKNLLVFAKTDDLLTAVIKARDELKAEIEKYKFKNIDKNRRQQRKTKHVNLI